MLLCCACTGGRLCGLCIAAVVLLGEEHRHVEHAPSQDVALGWFLSPPMYHSWPTAGLWLDVPESMAHWIRPVFRRLFLHVGRACGCRRTGPRVLPCIQD